MMDSLELEVLKWAKQKGIFESPTSLQQLSKMQEEVGELSEEVVVHYAEPGDNRENIKGELGDVLVTAIIQAHFHGLSLQSCLQQALDKITKRTGRMVDGQFVKDSY